VIEQVHVRAQEQERMQDRIQMSVCGVSWRREDRIQSSVAVGRSSPTTPGDDVRQTVARALVLLIISNFRLVSLNCVPLLARG